jgi:hypothetical protein
MLDLGGMEPTEITIEILRTIQQGIATSNARIETLEVATTAGFDGLRRDIAELRAALHAELARVHDGIETTNETLGLIHRRLAFLEAAAGAATGEG